MEKFVTEAIMCPVVLMRVLQVANNLDTTKNCRLVCKLWDGVASRHLRKNSVVRLNEKKKDQVKEFKELLIHRHLILKSEFPPPFQRFILTISTFTSSIFTEFVLNDIGQVICVIVDLVEAQDQPVALESLNDLFCQHSDTLEMIGLCLSDQTPALTARYGGANKNLSALQTLIFSDGCDRACSHADYVQSILVRSAVKNLSVTTRGGGVISEIFRKATSNSLTCVSDLKIFAFSPPHPADLGRIAAIRTLFNVTNLQLCLGPLDAKKSGAIRQLVNQLAHQLVKYESDSVPLEELNIICPVLREYKGEMLDRLCAKNVPALRHCTFQVNWRNLPLWHDKSQEMFESVTSLRVEGIAARDDVILIESKLAGYFMKLRHHFPNIIRLHFELPEFSSQFFVTCHRCFPKTKNLVLNGACSFEAFTGIVGKETIVQFGWTWDDIPRLHSILDMPCLETLELGELFHVTDDLQTFLCKNLSHLKLISYFLNGVRRTIVSQQPL